MCISIEASSDILNLLVGKSISSMTLKYILRAYEWKFQPQVYDMINQITFFYNYRPSLTSILDNGKIFAGLGTPKD